MIKAKRDSSKVQRWFIIGIFLFFFVIVLSGNSQMETTSTTSKATSFEANSQRPLKNPPSGRTLLLIHGYGLTAKIHFEDTYSNPYIQSYYNSVIPIDYYGAIPSSNQTYSLGRADFDLNTPIEEIALELKKFLLDPNNSGLLTDKIDVIGYSMGGLIVRYLIRTYYVEIKAANYTFENVVLIATPNGGVYHVQGFYNLFLMGYMTLSVLLSLIVVFTGERKRKGKLGMIFIGFLALSLILIAIQGFVVTISAQQVQMGSSFLRNLNYGDLTPHSVDDSPPYNDITWSTFRGNGGGKFFFERLLIAFSFVNKPCDGQVTVDSVILGGGATNYGPYDRNHDEMVMFDISLEKDRLYFGDIYYVLTGEAYPI